MLKDPFHEFTTAFAVQAADSDYSRVPLLRDTTQADIHATALAMYQDLRKQGLETTEMPAHLGERAVLKYLSAKVKTYADENALVSAEFTEYWDATDALSKYLNSGMRRNIEYALAEGWLAEQVDNGFLVVKFNGIWIYKLES